MKDMYKEKVGDFSSKIMMKSSKDYESEEVDKDDNLRMIYYDNFKHVKTKQ